MFHFCTYFDQHYLPRALALYRSLQSHCPAFKLWVLCMDQAAFELLHQLQLPEIQPIALADFEQGDEALLGAKQNRSKIEYYFTCTPSLPLYILRHWPEVELITYLDADLFLFSTPQPLYEEMQGHSIGIIGHRFPANNKGSEIYGKYNVGWLMFRRDDNGLACLQWWRERCIEWCYDRLEGDRFADQKYLDQWPDRFQGVVVLQHKGANLAPWNVEAYHLRYDEKRQRIFVDEDPLIFFHFHGVKRRHSWLYDPQWGEYNLVVTNVLRRKIYAPYIALLDEIYTMVAPLSARYALAGALAGDIRNATMNVAKQAWSERLAATLRTNAGMALRILSGKHYFLVIGGHTL